MAAYDYRCRTCEETFEVRRPIIEPESAPPCPQGHSDVGRVWSALALAGRAGGAPAPPRAAAGGCCGGGCCG